MSDVDVWKLLDGCRVDSGGQGTNVAFGYESLNEAVRRAIQDTRSAALKEAYAGCYRLRRALEKIAKLGARGMIGDELSACGQIAQSALDSLEVHSGDA